MSSAKTSSGSKDYYGHCAGIVCCGQLDFIWGFMVNNDLVWPKAHQWDSKIHQKNKTVIYTDGNVYQTSEKTDVDPPGAPWALFAIPWAAGTTVAGDKKLYAGNVWKASVDTTTNPPATAPDAIVNGDSLPHIGVQTDTATGDWIYVCTPQAWSGSTHFWTANSIVTWNGRVWINSADTNKEPGTDPVWALWKQDLGATNPFKFTVELMGDVYLYLGTGTQTLDTVNEQILNALGHPPYRHRAVVMLKNFLFGSSTTSPPNVTVLGGRKPVQTLIIDNSGVVGVDATAMDADWQVNPWCVLAELLTDPYIGLGLPASWFDSTSWQAEADRCAASPSLYYISPIYTSLRKVRELVADLMGYPDAFIFWSTLATLAAGHWPHHEAAPAFTAATTIDRNDLQGEIESSSEGWGGTANSAVVSFQDVEAGFTSRPCPAPNLFNRTITRRLTIQQIDRPHIVRWSQALAWATEFAKIAGDRTFQCSALSVRAEKAASVQQGGLFLLTDDVLGISTVMRCTKKTIAAAGTGLVKLSCEVERGVAPQPYAPTPANTAPGSGPGPATVINYAAVQLPAALAGAVNMLAIIAGRENDSTSTLEVWFRAEDSASFQLLGTNQGFAVAGILDVGADDELVSSLTLDSVTPVNIGAVTNGNTYNLGKTDFWQNQLFYSPNSSGIPYTVGIEGTDYSIDPIAGTVTILTGGGIATGQYVNLKLWQTLVLRYNTNTPQADLDAISAVPTEDEIADGQILIFAFQEANPALFEIMSVRSVTAAGTGSVGTAVFFVEVLRTQFGTLFGGDGTHVWGGNDVIMMIKKSSIDALSHVNFPYYHDTNATIHLRLAPASAWEQADITDLYDPASNPTGLATAFDYTFNNIYAPTVTWGQLLQNGTQITDFTVNFALTDVFNFGFELDSREGNLAHGALVAVQGQQEITLWASNLLPAGTFNKNIQFQLPTGNWQLYMRILDDSGNQSSTQLSYSGSPVTMYVNNGTAAAPIIYSYSDSNGYRNNLLFGLLPGTGAGFQVYYQIQNRNVAANPADWVTCSVYGAAISGLYRWGDPTYDTLPPIKKGSSGKTLYAYCTQTGKTDSDIVKWNF